MISKGFKTYSKGDYDSINVVRFLYKKRKFLSIVIVISIILFSVISLLIKDRYKSSVVLFPSSSGAISEVLLTNNFSSKDILAFGGEEEIEQMLQVLQSEEIKSKIIEKYNLVEHYGLEGKKYPKTKLDERFNNNITFVRTQYMSVVIEVLDENDTIAAEIANDISVYFDTIMNNLHIERAYKAFYIVKNEYLNLEEEITEIKDSLKKIEKLGVFDFDSQSEVLNNAYANAILKGNTRASQQLKAKLDILAEYGSSHEALSNMLEYEVLRLSDLKAKYTEAKVNAEQQLPYKYIVNKAVRAEKKSYPIRWIIVALGVLSTLILVIFVLIFLETFKEKRL